MTRFLVPADEWSEVRRRVAPFASRDEARVTMTRVFVRVRNRRREWVATDSYRMARWRSPHPADPMPGGTLHHSVFTNLPGDVEVTLEPTEFDCPLWSKQQVHHLMDKQIESQRLSLQDGSVKVLTEAVKVSRKGPKDAWGGSPGLLLTYDGRGSYYDMPPTIALTSHAGVNDHLRLAKGQPLGKPAWTAVNPRYLHSLVKAAGPGCTLHLPSSPLEAIKVTGERFVGLVMPVRT